MQFARELAALLLLHLHQAGREAVQLFAGLRHFAIALFRFRLERLDAADAEKREPEPEDRSEQCDADYLAAEAGEHLGHVALAEIELARVHFADAVGELEQLLAAWKELRAKEIAALSVARGGVPREDGVD